MSRNSFLFILSRSVTEQQGLDMCLQITTGLAHLHLEIIGTQVIFLHDILQGYKMKVKRSLDNKFLWVFWQYEPKKVADLSGLGSNLNIKSFFLTSKDVLKSILFLNFVDPDPPT